MIDRHFLDEQRLKYPDIFTNAERQVEGWFKGELLYLFTELKKDGILESWEPEAVFPNLGKKKSDFKVTIDGEPIYLELKTLYHGMQKNQPIDLGIYFYKDSVGIWNDIQKLSSLEDGRGFCILFVYPKPNRERWNKTLQKYEERILPNRIKKLSKIDEYPSDLFIAKIEIEKDQ